MSGKRKHHRSTILLVLLQIVAQLLSVRKAGGLPSPQALRIGEQSHLHNLVHLLLLGNRPPMLPIGTQGLGLLYPVVLLGLIQLKGANPTIAQALSTAGSPLHVAWRLRGRHLCSMCTGALSHYRRVPLAGQELPGAYQSLGPVSLVPAQNASYDSAVLISFKKDLLKLVWTLLLRHAMRS